MSPEQKVLDNICKMANFEPDILSQLASEIVEEGGIDTRNIKPQDLMDALAEHPSTPWSEVTWSLGEQFYYYNVIFGETPPDKWQALKVLFAITIMGIACRHGEPIPFENHFGEILKLLVKTIEPLWGDQLSVISPAIHSWKAADDQYWAAKRRNEGG